jgi:predicted nucleic acid-binding protein
MNQFAGLVSADKQSAIVLDCGTITAAKNGNKDAIQFRKKIATRKGLKKITVPCIAIEEICKLGQTSFDNAVSLIDSFSQNGQIDDISCSHDRQIILQAELLTAKYAVNFHYIDDHHVVIAKRCSALLVTLDKKLKDIARAEGILTFCPGNFRFYN